LIQPPGKARSIRPVYCRKLMSMLKTPMLVQRANMEKREDGIAMTKQTCKDG
jgi:hypothetical protein